MICKYCGADNNENRRTCKGCGRNLYEEQAVYGDSGGQQEYNNIQIPKKKKNIILWTCIGAGAVAVLAIVVAAVFLFKNINGNGYTAKLAEAAKYYSEMDYDSAIKIYIEAIEQNPDKPDAYIKLVNIYISLNDIAKAQQIALQGYEKTKDERLQELINNLFDTESVSEESTEITVNTEIIENIAGGSHESYTENYGAAVTTQENGYIKVSYGSFKASFYYSLNSVDKNTNKPLADASPEYVIISSPDTLINNYSGYLSRTTLQELFKNTIQVNMVDGVLCATAQYLNCSISIQCDEGGEVTSAVPYIKITPDYISGDNSNGLKGVATGTIKKSTDGTALADAHLTVRAGVDMKTGAVVAETDTDEKGNYTLNLSEGKYTVCVSKTGYKDQYFNIVVNKGMTMPGQDYAMTSDSSTSEGIKLVVEWGDEPADVDLHIQGQTPLGTYISVFGYGQRSLTAYENGKVVAKLEENVTTSNGQETITIMPEYIDGTYAVHVHDQTNRNSSTSSVLSNSGAVLKIYLPGETTPNIYNIPADTPGTCWYPCNIVKGKLNQPGTSSVMRFSTIG